MLERLVAISFLSLASVASADNTHNGDTSFSPAKDISELDWQDPVELERVWQASWVSFPATHGESAPRTITEIVSGDNIPTKKYPTVIFVHGCAGMLAGEKRRVDFFAANGYAVISPISFARKKYPKSCRIFPKRAFMYRGTLGLRHHDIAYTILKAKALDWVDENNIFLVGHSEGAVLVTTFQHAEAAVNARVAESWTCHSDWPEYQGVNAPTSEPVLTLVSKNDPWFQKPPAKGSCDSLLDKNNGSQSRVYEDDVTWGKHKVLDYPKVQQHVLSFMKHYRR